MDRPEWARLIGLGGAGGQQPPDGDESHRTRRHRDPGKPATGLRKASCGYGRYIGIGTVGARGGADHARRLRHDFALV